MVLGEERRRAGQINSSPTPLPPTSLISFFFLDRSPQSANGYCNSFEFSQAPSEKYFCEKDAKQNSTQKKTTTRRESENKIERKCCIEQGSAIYIDGRKHFLKIQYHCAGSSPLLTATSLSLSLSRMNSFIF